MSLQPLKKPLRMIPNLPQRAPQSNIPQTLDEREWLRARVIRYVEEQRESLVPPLVLDELKIHAEALVARAGVDPVYRDYVGVLINNEVWSEHLATVPFNRRLLLLPSLNARVHAMLVGIEQFVQIVHLNQIARLGVLQQHG